MADGERATCRLESLGPGGFANNGKDIGCTGGSHRYIDIKVFGHTHIYDEPTCMESFGCQIYDPEGPPPVLPCQSTSPHVCALGLVGAFNAVLLTYLGLVAGRILQMFTDVKDRMVRLFAWSILCMGIAAALCGCSQNNGAIPVNKNLWSTRYPSQPRASSSSTDPSCLSFVLLTAGGGFSILAVVYYLVDHIQVWSGAPFFYVGMNSIFVYCGSGVFEEYFPFGWKWDQRSHWDIMAANCCGVLTWILISIYMYHHKIFIKL